MATQEELEAFLAGQSPAQQVAPFAASKKKRVPLSAQNLAIEAATQLTPGANFGGGSNTAIRRHLGGGTPAEGPRLFDQTTNPEAVARPETTAISDVSGGVARRSVDVPQVQDRFQDLYNQSLEAIDTFNRKGVSQVPVTGNRYDPNAPSVRATARKNSPERAALLRRSNRAFQLLQGGSFADVTNAKREQRLNQAASAENFLSSAQLNEQRSTSFDADSALLQGEQALERKQKRGTSDLSFDPEEVFNRLDRSF
jgi:hypothetical protein